MASCEAAGPLRDALRSNGLGRRLSICACSCYSLRLHQLCLVIGTEVLHHPLRDQQQRINQAPRQQHPQSSARSIDPKVTQRLRLSPRDAPDQCHCQRDPDRCGKEVMVGQSEHLRQIAHRHLWHIRLPVRVRRKRYSSIKRKIRGHRGEMLRIERQQVLQPFDRVRRKQRDQAEEQRHNCIFCPRHLAGLIDPRQTIDKPLDRPKDAIGPGPFPLKDTRHIHTQGLGAKQYQCKEEENLKPAVRRHVKHILLKLFRAQQRVHQINQQGQGHKTKRQCFDHRGVSFVPNRSHPTTYPMAIAKNKTLATTHPMSHMVLPPAKYRADAISPIQAADA